MNSDDPKDRARFGGLMMQLHASLGGDPPDTIKLATYWSELHTFDWSVLEASLKVLIRTRSKRDGFPSVGDWLARAKEIHVERIRTEIQPERVWEDSCARCADTGFEYVERATGRACDAPPVGPADRYVVRSCGCRDSNPTYQRRHGRLRACAPPPPPKSGPVRGRRGALERFHAGVPPERHEPSRTDKYEW
jgi:hypothetical protein